MHPTFGPSLDNGEQASPVTEHYKVFGYADDIKPAVTNMAEFALVDKAASHFKVLDATFKEIQLQESVSFCPWAGGGTVFSKMILFFLI